MDFKYNTIEEALDELRNGRIILVTDDPDRENEGDMICAAEFATQANVNFMATYAKGLLCTNISLHQLLELVHFVCILFLFDALDHFLYKFCVLGFLICTEFHFFLLSF